MVLSVGPYLTEEPTSNQVLERAESMSVHPSQTGYLKNYYASLPVFAERGIVMSLLETFADSIWGGHEAFQTVDINQDVFVPGSICRVNRSPCSWFRYSRI